MTNDYSGSKPCLACAPMKNTDTVTVKVPTDTVKYFADPESGHVTDVITEEEIVAITNEVRKHRAARKADTEQRPHDTNRRNEAYLFFARLDETAGLEMPPVDVPDAAHAGESLTDYLRSEAARLPGGTAARVLAALDHTDPLHTPTDKPPHI